MIGICQRNCRWTKLSEYCFRLYGKNESQNDLNVPFIELLGEAGLEYSHPWNAQDRQYILGTLCSFFDASIRSGGRFLSSIIGLIENKLYLIIFFIPRHRVRLQSL